MLVQVLKKLQHWRFTSQAQQAFLHDLAALIADGVPAQQAIETLINIKEGIGSTVAQGILNKIAEGKPIAEGMRDWFAPHIVEIVRVGEQGGTLPASLDSAAASLMQKQGVIITFLNSLLYPLVVLCAAFVVMVFIHHSILAVYINIRPLEEWPADGRRLYKFAGFIEKWWWIIPIVGVSLFLGVSKVLRDYIGEGRNSLDRLPGLSIYRRLTAARFMETLGFLIANGLVFKNALKIMQHSANPYLASHMLVMEYRLGGGKDNIADVLDTGLIDKNDIMRLRAVAQGKGFEHALVRQGKQASDNGVKTLRNIGKLLGFVVLASGAILAAFIILSMYDVGMLVGAR